MLKEDWRKNISSFTIVIVSRYSQLAFIVLACYPDLSCLFSQEKSMGLSTSYLPHNNSVKLLNFGREVLAVLRIAYSKLPLVSISTCVHFVRTCSEHGVPATCFNVCNYVFFKKRNRLRLIVVF